MTRISNPKRVTRMRTSSNAAQATPARNPSGRLKDPMAMPGQFAASARFLPCGNTSADDEVRSRQ